MERIKMRHLKIYAYGTDEKGRQTKKIIKVPIEEEKRPRANFRAVFQSYFPSKLYFWLFTRKGLALSKEDFASIKAKDKELYRAISSRQCTGRAPLVCFEIAKTLQKGDICYLVKKDLLSVDTSTYRLHVLYINNGWAFDTTTRCQYPLEEFLKMCDGIIFRRFSYSEFQDYRYWDSFYATFEDEITKWCEKNNYYMWRRNPFLDFLL